MIQAYINTNRDYTHNGDMALMPTKCELTAKLNGTWTVKLEHPIDTEGRWRFITDEAVIKMPSFNGTQLFRVYERNKSDRGVVAKLLPIFFDAAKEVFIPDIRPTDRTGQEALSLLVAGTIYQAQSDILTRNTAYYVRKNLLECISGKDDNAFIKRWGGEAIYDNYKIYLNARAGADNGVTVRYGLNLQTNGFEEIVDMSSVYTRIYPQGYNGAASSTYVDSPLIDSYPNIRCLVKEYRNIRMADDVSGSNTEGLTICYNQQELDEALTAAVEADFAAGLDKPAVTIKAKMVLLQNTEEYKDYQNLASVSLGDTVHVFHTRLGITSAIRVCELKYDAVTDEITEVTLGEPTYNYFDSNTNQLKALGSSVSQNTEAIHDVRYLANTTQQEARAIRSYFWTDEYGAHVTTEPDDATNGKNVLIDAAGLAVRDGTTELATFGENKIELGKGNPEAKIDLIDGSVRMNLDEQTGGGYQLFSIQEHYSPNGNPTSLHLSVSNGDPGGNHITPSVSMTQKASTDSYGTEVQVLGEKLTFSALSLNQTSKMNLLAEASMNLDCTGGIWANGNPISPYKTTTITGVRFVRQGNIVLCRLNKSQSMTANTQFSIGTIPSGYRPIESTVIAAQFASTSTPVGHARLVAGSDGSFVGQESSHTGTYVLYATACWVTNDSIS